MTLYDCGASFPFAQACGKGRERSAECKHLGVSCA